MKNKLALRKIFNIVQVALLLITLIIVIIAPYGEFMQYNWIIKYDPVIGYHQSEIVSDYINEPVLARGEFHFFDFMSNSLQVPLLLIPTVFLVILLLLTVFSVFRKSDHRDSLLHIVLPILFMIAFSFFILFGIDIKGGPVFTAYSGSTPFVPVAILMGVVLILSFMKRSKSFNPKEKVIVEQVNKSDAEELKRYKELLDIGAITQDEFDAKKKQLLNL